MKVIIAGASGMVGNLVLQECIQSDQINEIISLARKPSNSSNSKINEIIISDFTDYSNHNQHFKNVSAAFFCIGAYTGQVKDDEFKLITVDYAIEFAKALAENSPGVRLSFLSGQGADRTEKSRMSFAKYKGIAENQIAKLDLEFHTFRPGYIYPVTPRVEPSLMYKISRSLYPLLKLFGKNISIKSTELAKGMFQVAMSGNDKEVLENRDILAVVNG